MKGSRGRGRKPGQRQEALLAGACGNPGQGRATGGKRLDLNIFSRLEPKDFLTAWMRVVGEKEESRTTPRVWPEQLTAQMELPSVRSRGKAVEEDWRSVRSAF